MVFARKHDDETLASLVRQLDAMIAQHKDAQLAAFVCLLGADDEVLEVAAKELGTKSEAKHVPLVVPVEHADGPAGFQLSPDADVTVLCYKKATVTANHAFAEGKLDKAGVEAVIASTKAMLE